MTILPRLKDVAKSRLNLRNPWHLLATGFGSGLSPVVPGTMGSLAAIPFWYLMTFLPWQLYSLVVMFGICIGVYLCHQTAKDMGVHDHGSIVWDEFIGMWITLMALRQRTGSGWLPASLFSVFWICGNPGRSVGLIVTYMAEWGL
ncbi:phosphatidylglycerophosphatase A [Salmonella bongori]|nr:phosphatidylglycerophosphatase A [Salmonella bongori]